MDRRASLKLIGAGTVAFITGSAIAKKKNKNKKNNNNKNNNKTKTQKVSGEIVLVKENITNIYKIVSGKVYTFSRAIEGKVSGYVGQKVTVHGRVDDDRIVTIEVVVPGGK